jgi:hypothetical protein
LEDSSSSEEEDAILIASDIITDEPTSFEEAWYHGNVDKQIKWREAIGKELTCMETCKVWTLIKKCEIPKDRKPIGCRWVFKEKRDGTQRARLVALGYSQVAGVDFFNNYSPVIDDSSFRIILLMIEKLKLEAWSIDIETAFLNGDLEEEIFMKIPQGMEVQLAETKALKLNKSIYGLVQAARQWHKKFSEEILKLGFMENNIDPCVFMKQEGMKFCILCIYVDGNDAGHNSGSQQSFQSQS